jgi:predicted Zn-dependent protease with MMP-like domain
MGRHIIMNYTVSPSRDDLEIIAAFVLENIPDELEEHCETLKVVIEDLIDEVTEDELGLDDPFDLLALYKSGKEVSPGVQRKTANDDDTLILYRRAILDMWCDTGEDLTNLIRQVIIEELGRSFEFSEDEILEMSQRPYQALVA